MRTLKVLFVCTGNTCRSPIAEGILRKLCSERRIKEVEVRSCGTIAALGSTVPPIALEVAKRRQIDLSGHRSAPLTKELIEGSDVILGMDESHVERVIELVPGAKTRAFLLSEFCGGCVPSRRDIVDPAGGQERAYEESLTMIESLVNKSLELLTRMVREKDGKGEKGAWKKQAKSG
ncbi:MAG: low molecular weight protein arginine phosphatase [Candidatus Eisenbacteria bacterium]|nr:low molecular weight protein arginine phosphatase [Candidatus Eisenbacteria bacterium]